MSCVRTFTVASLAALVVGCASTPPPRSADNGYSMHALRLCPGMSVSNAPQTDSAGFAKTYSPMTVLRGVMLARAPVDACLSSGYGPRSGGAGSFHDGLDLYTGSPRAVLAGGDGRIAFISELRGYGLTVEIDHGDGVATRYAHLSKAAPGLRVGEFMRAGDHVGQSGRTGNATAVHLHYEIRLDGRPLNPLTAGD